MVNAFGIFNFYLKNDRAFRAVHNFRHFTLFEFLKLFAKKTQKLEIRN